MPVGIVFLISTDRKTAGGGYILMRRRDQSVVFLPAVCFLGFEMLFPVRCYTCNTVLAQHRIAYEQATRACDSGETAAAVLDARGVTRLCCRRMFLGYVDILSEHLSFAQTDMHLDSQGTVLRRKPTRTITVSCD